MTLSKVLNYTEGQYSTSEIMKLGNDSVKNKFDDIGHKIDELIMICQTLRSENKALLSRIRTLESELDKQAQKEERFSEHETLVQSRIDVLLSKLDSFVQAEETRPDR